MMRSMRNLHAAEDVTQEMEPLIESTLAWFPQDEPLSGEDFIDRFALDHGGQAWDIENYNSPASQKILRIARRMRREQNE